MGNHKYMEPQEISLLCPEMTWPLPYKNNGVGIYRIFSEREGHSPITQTNKKKRPNGYIYFLKIKGQDLYKLGVSHKPDRRLADINSYLPFDFDILSLHYLLCAYDLEQEILKEHSIFKVKREWMRLTTNQAKNIMCRLHNQNVIQTRNAPH